MPFGQLALKSPKDAVERISANYHLYCKERPASGKSKLSEINNLELQNYFLVITVTSYDEWC